MPLMFEPTDLVALHQLTETQRAQQRTVAREPLDDIAPGQLAEEADAQEVELETPNNELKSARAELDTLLASYAELYNCDPAGYFTFDSNGCVLQVNMSGAVLLGMDSNHMMNSHFGLFLDTRQQSIFNHFLAMAFSTNATQSCELTVLIAGRQNALSLGMEGVVAEDHSECRAVVVDISRLKQSENKFSELNKQLEQYVIDRTDRHRRAEMAAQDASFAKSRFLANMSHEIRTPMTGVLGMAEILSKTKLNAEQQEIVELMQESSTALLDTVNDIQELSEVESGKVEVDLVRTHIATLIESVGRLLEIGAEQGGVELTLFVDPLVPDTVLCDSVRLRQVLINLVGNAIKFSSREDCRGRVQLRVQFYPVGNTSGTLEIAIIDNGMDSQSRAKIHRPFKQGGAMTKRRYGGSGLGLTICYSLLALMDGELSVDSSPGKGSTFTVRIEVEKVSGEVGDSRELLPDVAGLACLVVGGGQADDFSCYLRHAGAIVEQAPDLAETATWMTNTSEGVWVWLVDESEASPSREKLAALVEDARIAGTRLGIALILHGRRREPREVIPGVVTLDCIVLMRRGLLATVALAAGREVKLKDVAQPLLETPRKLSSIADAEASGYMILLAEDNRMNQRVIVLQLRSLGYAVEVAGDGREALAMWKSGRYSLLLVDFHMPHMDGFELTRQIRKLETSTGERKPIIGISSSTVASEFELSATVGMDGSVSKPATLETLLEKLEQWLPLDGSGVTRSRESASDAQDEGGVVDWEALGGYMGTDDEVLLREFFTDFLHHGASMLEEIAQAKAAQDAAQVGSLAHRFKSSTRMVGANTLADSCLRLESAGLESRWRDIHHEHALLQEFFAAVVAEAGEHDIVI
jgi:signal transduction histidine kinase/CheY-like chemotaxis protein/HPt (histidine-containing phosphotransfer) domain-containing protein